MEKKELKVNDEMKRANGDLVPKYEPPKIITYTNEDILGEDDKKLLF